jgi:hypothetical protein
MAVAVRLLIVFRRSTEVEGWSARSLSTVLLCSRDEMLMFPSETRRLSEKAFCLNAAPPSHSESVRYIFLLSAVILLTSCRARFASCASELRSRPRRCYKVVSVSAAYTGQLMSQKLCVWRCFA